MSSQGVCGVEVRERTTTTIKIGVRNCDEPLCVGTVFTEAVNYVLDTNDKTKVIAVNPQAIHLVVISIYWYGRNIIILDPGHTALLTLEGSGFEFVTEQCGLRP
jgi:hypothetical protein